MKKIFLLVIILFTYSYSQENRIIRQQELSDSLDAVRTLIGTGGVPLPDSTLFSSDSLAQRIYSDLKYVDKTSTQTITGQKDFTSGIKLSDTTNSLYFYNPFTAPYGFYRMRSWNIWVNNDGRPDVGFALGYNMGTGGGVVDADDIAMGMMIESHYTGNGYPASELHLMSIRPNGTQHRFLTADFNKSTYSTGLGFNADKIYTAEDDGSIIWMMQNGYIDYYQPYFSRFGNNVSAIANWNKNNTSWIFLPYIDNYDRYTFGDIDSVTSGSQFLHLYQTGLRFDNTFGISSYNTNNDLTKILYYNSDELRIQADTNESIKLRASNLYFENIEGGLTDIINPALPFDTTGLEAGMQYVELATGQIKMRIGENLIANGDFSSWTWDGNGTRPTGYTNYYFSGDSNNAFVENVNNQLHYSNDGNSQYAISYTSSSCAIGETYLYSFNLVNWNADSAVIFIGGVPLNQNYSNLTAGYKTGEIIATSTTYFSIFGLTEIADITLDNLRIWEKTGGNITIPAYNVPVILDSLGDAIAGVGSTSTGNPDSLGGQPASAYMLKADSTIYLTPNDASVAYATKSHTHTEFADTFNVAGWSMGAGNSSLDTIVTGSFGGIKIPNNITVTEVSAYTNSGTVTFNIEERGETTPNTSGTDVMTSDLVADSDQQETSTFSNSTLDRNDWLILTIVSITGDPTIFSVTVRGVKTN